MALSNTWLSIMSDENKETKERMQTANIKMQAYNMKMEMVSGANLVHEAIDLVEKCLPT
jgi:hypothetical protein